MGGPFYFYIMLAKRYTLSQIIKKVDRNKTTLIRGEKAGLIPVQSVWLSSFLWLYQYSLRAVYELDILCLGLGNRLERAYDFLGDNLIRAKEFLAKEYQVSPGLAFDFVLIVLLAVVWGAQLSPAFNQGLAEWFESSEAVALAGFDSVGLRLVKAGDGLAGRAYSLAGESRFWLAKAGEKAKGWPLFLSGQLSLLPEKYRQAEIKNELLKQKTSNQLQAFYFNSLDRSLAFSRTAKSRLNRGIEKSRGSVLTAGLFLRDKAESSLALFLEGFSSGLANSRVNFRDWLSSAGPF